MRTLLEVVCACIERLHVDGGIVTKGYEQGLSWNRLRFPAPSDSQYVTLATEIIQFWGEKLDEPITPDFYRDIVLGIREWAKWTKLMRHAKEWHIMEARKAVTA